MGRNRYGCKCETILAMVKWITISVEWLLIKTCIAACITTGRTTKSAVHIISTLSLVKFKPIQTKAFRFVFFCFYCKVSCTLFKPIFCNTVELHSFLFSFFSFWKIPIGWKINGFCVRTENRLFVSCICGVSGVCIRLGSASLVALLKPKNAEWNTDR